MAGLRDLPKPSTGKTDGAFEEVWPSSTIATKSIVSARNMWTLLYFMP
jgi:hypothetical protein